LAQLSASQPAGAAAPAPATISVTSATGLKAALANATGGETIVLAAGDYGSLSLSSLQFTQPVRIVTDPAAPAVLHGLKLTKVSGLDLDGLTFDFVYKAGMTKSVEKFQIDQSSGITIRNARFDGDDIYGTGTLDDGYGGGTGLAVTYSRDIALIDSQVSGFMKGLKIFTSTNVVLRGNDLHDMRSDTISLSEVHNVLIEDNHLHDRRMAPGSADHADFIQTQTKNASQPITGLTIRGNLFDIGHGSEMQSLFLSNQAVNDGAGPAMYHQNVVVEDNVILNAQPNGIVIGATSGLVLRNNTVLEADPATGPGSGAPRISVEPGSTQVTITGNVSAGMNGYSGQAGWQVANNFSVQNDDPSAPNHYSAHFVNPTGELGGHPEKLLLQDDSPIALAGAGAAGSHLSATPDQLTPVIEAAADPANLALYVLDAGLTAGSAGMLDSSTARFDWSFSDGVAATGQKIARQFDTPGLYTATLTVTDALGHVATTDTEIAVTGPDLIRRDPATGLLVAGPGGSKVLYDPPGGGETMLDLAAATGGMITLTRSSFAPIFAAGSFEIALNLKADPGAGGFSELLRLHGSILVDVDAAGDLEMMLQDVAGRTVTVKSGGARLYDGAAHDVVLHYDAGTGQASVTVDGRIGGTGTLPGTLDPALGRDMTLGGAFGRQPFDGKIAAFALRADAGLYAFGADLDILDPILNPPAPAGAPAPASALAPDAPVLPDSDALLDLLARDYADAGLEVIRGSDSADVLAGGPMGAVLIGAGGDDRLRDGRGDDVLTGGDGADQFVFDLRSATGPSHDIVTDLDFGAGDILRFLLTDGTLRLRSLAELDAALDSGVLAVTGAADGDGVAIALAADPGKVIDLAFLEGADLLLA
jgi:PKD repeat protein